MPLDPELGGTIKHVNANLKGVEYQSAKEGIFPAIAENQNVPCARCFTKRTASMMLPGKRTCPDGWVKEYQGRVCWSMYNHAQLSVKCISFWLSVL